MEKKTPSEKAIWFRFILLFLLFSSLWFFLFYWITKRVNHTGEVLFYGTPSSTYWVFFLSAALYGITTWGIYFTIKQGIYENSFQSFKKGTQLVLTLAGLPLLISLPFLYLGITHAIVINEDKIQYEPFWSFKEEDYSWDEDVQGVVIDYSVTRATKIPHQRHFNGKYIIHFKDGKKIDIWEGVLEGNLSIMKKMDSIIQEKQIPVTVRQEPSPEIVDEFFNDTDRKIIHALYSR